MLLAVIVQSVLVSGFFLYLARRTRHAPCTAAVLLVAGNASAAVASTPAIAATSVFVKCVFVIATSPLFSGASIRS